MQRGHHGEVRHAVVHHQLRGLQMFIAIVDGLGRLRAKAGIDAFDRTLHLRFDPAIVLDLRPAGHRNLHEAEASLIRWILLEEPLDGCQPVHDALGVVEPIHPQPENRKRQVRVRTPAYDLARHAASTGQTRPPGIVDANGERSDPRFAPLVLHHPGFVVDAGAQHSLRTL